MQTNILSKFKKIIISLIVLIITMQSVCFADFTEAQKTYIYGFVKQVAAMDTAYTIRDENALKMGYQLQSTYGTYADRGYSGTHIWLCCATWVSTILNKCFNIEISIRDATDGYARTDGWINPLFREVSESEIECGDIVLWDPNGLYYGHMGMYLGDGMVTDCSPSNYPQYGNGHNQNGGVYVRNLWPGAKYLRYTPDATTSDGNLGPGGPIDSAIDAIKEWRYKYVVIPFREANESEIDKDKKFEYQGITKTESETTTDITNKEDNWAFSLISNLIEWILNFIVTTIKSVFVGFGTLVQVLVSFYIDAASGEDVSTRMSDGMMAYFTSGGLKEDIANSITMEKIVYNKVPLLDVDVFNGNVAGGKTLSSSSLVVIIRNVVANLYMGIRTVSLIGLLLALIYYGIKFVITGIAEQKAEYKQKLVNWAIAFFIVFGIHYFLIAVMKINEVVVNLIGNIGTNVASEISGGKYFDLANAMRELTYQNGVVKSILSTCLYLAMVYYLIKFLVIYFKRLFVTLILIILAPLIGIKFAIDKLKFKESTTLTTWAKEYIFSVGTQTIHALVYTIFIGITYKMVLNIDSAKMAVCILAFIFFRFMTEAEKILRKFLKLAGGSASSIMGDAKSNHIEDLLGWTIVKRITGYANKTPVPNYVKNRYKSGKKSIRNQFENEYVEMKRNEYIRKYNKAYGADKNGTSVKVISNVDKKIEEVLKNEFNYKLETALNNVGNKWKIVRGAERLLIGIPISIVEDTLVGTGLVAVGGNTLVTALGEEIKGYKSSKETAKYRAKNGTYNDIQAWVNQNATKKVAEELRNQYLYQKDDNLAENQAKLTILHEARAAEVTMEYEIAKQKEGLLKGADGVDSTTKIQNQLAKTYTRNIRRQVEDIMKTVDKKDIQKTVKDYMKKNHLHSLTMEDFRLISEELDNIQVQGKDIDAYLNIEGLTENIKYETMAKFISDLTKNEGLGENSTLVLEVMDQVQENIKEKMENTTDNSEKQSLLNAMKCVDDRKHKLNGEEVQNVYSNLSPEEQQKVRTIVEEATKDNGVKEKIEQAADQMGDSKEMSSYVKGLKADQVVDLIKKAVDKEGSIQKEYPAMEIPEFKPILEQAQKMKELNELSKEIGGEPIYQDVGKLVERMIKDTNIRLDKDNRKEQYN